MLGIIDIRNDEFNIHLFHLKIVFLIGKVILSLVSVEV